MHCHGASLFPDLIHLAEYTADVMAWVPRGSWTRWWKTQALSTRKCLYWSLTSCALWKAGDTRRRPRFLPALPYGEKARPCPARGWRHPGGGWGRRAEGRSLAGRDACVAGLRRLCLWVNAVSPHLRTERCEREVASCKILGAGELWVVLK